MPPAQFPVLLITMGDPAGIGPEVCAGAAVARTAHRDVALVLVGDGNALAGLSGENIEQFERIDPGFDRDDLSRGQSYLVDLCVGEEPVQPGLPGSESARRSMRFLEAAVALLGRGVADALVTGPICKKAWRAAGFNYPGHTEYLRQASGADRTGMVFLAGDLRVALFTTHISLKEVIRAVKRERLVAFIGFVAREFERFGLSRLRIGIAGLNPHAGEGGLFGDEDESEVQPAVEECRAAGLDVRGPFPADTLFHAASRKRFDLIVALYHDQGLIPVKTLCPWSAVNVTLGLPFVRTSPAHGTAFDLAGKGTARSEGMIAAVDAALDLIAAKRSIN